MNNSKSNKNSNPGIVRILWAITSLFALYCTLIPFDLCPNIECIISNIHAISRVPFRDPDGTMSSIPDIVQNILFFIPFGFLGFYSIHRKNMFATISIVMITGGALSLTLETLQLFTATRTTSSTDLVTNTAGAVCGAAAAAILRYNLPKFKASLQIEKYTSMKYFFPLIVSFLVIIIGALEPFDLTLDVGSIRSKIKILLYDPVHFTPLLKDEGVVFFRYTIFSYVCILFFRERARRNFIIKGMSLSCLTGIFLEVCQIMVSSRAPTAQDAAVITLGSMCGGLLLSFVDHINLSSKIWAIIVILMTWFTSAINILNPFSISLEYKSFNWMPFLPYYERTTFIALANFIESAIMFFPMGFILQYLTSAKKHHFILIGTIALIIASPLEIMQGWVKYRYPDITDILGALSGAILGSWVCTGGWTVFYSYIKKI